jgi:hypothetical protein
VEIAKALGYLQDADSTVLLQQCDRVSRLLNGLMQSLRPKLVARGASASE